MHICAHCQPPRRRPPSRPPNERKQVEPSGLHRQHPPSLDHADWRISTDIHLDHSPALLASLQRQGQPATAYSPTLTASYNLRISLGNYVTAAFTWVRHPAITPPLPTACVATITYSLFF